MIPSTVEVPALGNRVLAICFAGLPDLERLPALLGAFRTRPARFDTVVVVRATAACTRSYALAYGAAMPLLADDAAELESAYALGPGRPFSIVVGHLGATVATIDESDPVGHVDALGRALSSSAPAW
jgi:hypothetical protein